MAAGAGKAIALDEQIITPKGFKRYGDIKEGDLVFSELGRLIEVQKVHEIQNNKPCIKITFDDETTITCDEEHLWEVVNSKTGGKEVLSTRDLQIMQEDTEEFLWSIPNTKPLEYLAGTLKQRNNILQKVISNSAVLDNGVTISIPVSSPEFRKEITLLLNSLGISCKYKEGYITYSVNSMDSSFDSRTIISLEYTESVPVRCITVDNPTSLFLIGEQMVPTHNTFAITLLPLKHQGMEDFNTIIFRKTKEEVKKPGGPLTEASGMYMRFPGVSYNSTEIQFKFPYLNEDGSDDPNRTGMNVKYDGLEHEEKKLGHQGAQYENIIFDELTHKLMCLYTAMYIEKPC